MTIKAAIEQAKQDYVWTAVYGAPMTVSVCFRNMDGEVDETELDLYEDDKETELEELWESLCDEMDSAPDKIVSVEAYDDCVD